MENISVIEHIIAVIGGIVTLASAIVKWTPTPDDDAILGKVISVLNFLAINKTKY